MGGKSGNETRAEENSPVFFSKKKCDRANYKIVLGMYKIGNSVVFYLV